MPLYEYQCEACSHRYEVIQRLSDPTPAVCPACGRGPVRQLLSSPAIQFKGSGWYITDYARKGQTGDGSGAPKTDDKKSDAAPATSPTKPESAAPTPTTPSATSKEQT